MKSFSIFKRIKQEWFITFVITFLSTVLGVYYGFVLNEQRIEKELEDQKNVVINNIKLEIDNNEADLIETVESIESWVELRNSFNAANVDENDYFIAKEVYESKFNGEENFIIKDTLRENDGIYYRGHLNFQLIIPNFSLISYETAKYKNVLNELSFDCLYEIESTYVKQKSISNQMSELIRALQERDYVKVQNIMVISLQLGNDLKEKYAEMETLLDECN